MDTKGIPSDVLEVLHGFQFTPYFDAVRTVLLTHRAESINDLRAARELIDVGRAQGRVEAVDDLVEVLSKIPALMDARRKSGGSR